MSAMSDFHHKTSIQAKVFDFALTELVRKHRGSFKPVWTIDSWVKFLIWLALNCGLSGERESLELFADAMGQPLTSRMRRVFFERCLDDSSIKLMADPAESQVLIMPISGRPSIEIDQVKRVLDQVDLTEKIVLDERCWKFLDSAIAIPWQSSEIDTRSS